MDKFSYSIKLLLENTTEYTGAAKNARESSADARNATKLAKEAHVHDYMDMYDDHDAIRDNSDSLSDSEFRHANAYEAHERASKAHTEAAKLAKDEKTKQMHLSKAKNHDKLAGEHYGHHDKMADMVNWAEKSSYDDDDEEDEDY